MTADWSEEQSDWMIAALDSIDKMLSSLVAHSANIDYEGVRAVRGIPRERRKFMKVPSIGLAAFHAGRAMALGETAVRKLPGSTPAHKAVDLLRKTIRKMPVPPPKEGARP